MPSSGSHNTRKKTKNNKETILEIHKDPFNKQKEKNRGKRKWHISDIGKCDWYIYEVKKKLFYKQYTTIHAHFERVRTCP